MRPPTLNPPILQTPQTTLNNQRKPYWSIEQIPLVFLPNPTGLFAKPHWSIWQSPLVFLPNPTGLLAKPPKDLLIPPVEDVKKTFCYGDNSSFLTFFAIFAAFCLYVGELTICRPISAPKPYLNVGQTLPARWANPTCALAKPYLHVEQVLPEGFSTPCKILVKPYLQHIGHQFHFFLYGTMS